MTGYTILKTENVPEIIQKLLQMFSLDDINSKTLSGAMSMLILQNANQLVFFMTIIFLIKIMFSIYKPRWVVCILCTVSLVILTLSAVSAGVLIGYTYCYVENRSGVKTVNTTQTNGAQSYQASSNSVQVNDKTINEALFMLVQRILKIGHNIWDDSRYSLPWMSETKNVKPET